MNASPTRLPAVDALVRAHSPALLRHLRHRLGDAAVAEDLLQETLIKAVQGLGGFDARSSLRTWLRAIADHVVTDHLRSVKRHRMLVGPGAADELAADEPSPEERVEAAATSRCVRRVLDTLSARDRAAITLHDLAGLDGAGTAAALGVSVGAARVGVHRARARLEVALNRHCDIRRDGASGLQCAPRARPMTHNPDAAADRARAGASAGARSSSSHRNFTP